MHSLARRACIENAWHFEFLCITRRKLKVLTKTAQRQNAQASAVFPAEGTMHLLAPQAYTFSRQAGKGKISFKFNFLQARFERLGEFLCAFIFARLTWRMRQVEIGLDHLELDQFQLTVSPSE